MFQRRLKLLKKLNKQLSSKYHLSLHSFSTLSVYFWCHVLSITTIVVGRVNRAYDTMNEREKIETGIKDTHTVQSTVQNGKELFHLRYDLSRGWKSGSDDNESDNKWSGNIIAAKSTWLTLFVVLIIISVAENTKQEWPLRTITNVASVNFVFAKLASDIVEPSSKQKARKSSKCELYHKRFEYLVFFFWELYNVIHNSHFFSIFFIVIILVHK